jgi:hypothetical protein
MEIPNQQKEKKYLAVKSGQRRSYLDELLAECRSVFESRVVVEINDCSCTLYKLSKCGLTQRAPDLGYAPRFLGIFLALGLSRFEGESTLPPQAGNASR